MTVEAVLIGAGQRGHHVYGRWAKEHPGRLRFVAVSDPSPERRDRFADAHGLGAAAIWEDALELLSQPRLAEAAFVASPDRHHEPHTIAALDAGYQVLAEKPMADTLEGCRRVVEAVESTRGTLHIGHVLRFTPFFQTLHHVISSGRIGEVVTVEHRENLAAYHMAHSFVRGNWGRREHAPPMIVAKCTHDFDILHWNLGSRVKTISSVGNLFEFHPERAPAGATERCTDPCPATDCPYDARRIYLNPAWTGWPVHVITDDLSQEGRLAALRTGPYGICAYRAGSNVVDHQVVVMELESGASATLIMQGHSNEEHRTMRYDGTRATLRGQFGRTQEITIYDHSSGQITEVPIPKAGSGHGGGDDGIIERFLEGVETGIEPATSAAESMASHYLAFMAEEARVQRRVISLD